MVPEVDADITRESAHLDIVAFRTLGSASALPG